MFKKALFLICLMGNLFSKDLITVYREQGITAVQNTIEQVLKDNNYWEKFLENKNVDFGYYESKKYILIAQKDSAELTLYKNNNNESFDIISRNSVIVGKNDGDKQLEGDERTPEGVYELVQKKNDVDSFYGPLALVTSYPNTLDKTMNKKGSGIWIHGMPLNQDREKFTKGCIALDNPQLVQLSNSIELEKAILITAQNEFPQVTKKDMATILASIFQWKEAWRDSNIQEYISFYSNDFKRDDGLNFQSFLKFKKDIFSKYEPKKIEFNNINISPYPNSMGKKIYRVIMDENYSSPSVIFKGKKELFVEIQNNQVKILAES